jgi:hypothetical protein
MTRLLHSGNMKPNGTEGRKDTIGDCQPRSKGLARILALVIVSAISIKSIISTNTVRQACSYQSTEISFVLPKAEVFLPNREDFQYCEANNIVLGRSDRLNVNLGETKRPYSLNELDYAPFHNHALPACTSAHEVELSLRLGQREWDDPVHANWSSIEKERVGSHFVPSNCRIENLISNQLCQVLDE